MLVVDDGCDDRETLRELFMWIESETKLPIVFQVAKKWKRSCYLHHAGACFDMIVMDDLMPIMNGIESLSLKIKKPLIHQRSL